MYTLYILLFLLSRVFCDVSNDGYKSSIFRESGILRRDVTDVYVNAISGSDSNPDGTSQLPFKTIGKAFERWSSINSIIVHLSNGTYQLSDINLSIHNVTIIATSTRQATLKVGDSEYGFYSSDSNYLTITGVVITGGNENGKNVLFANNSLSTTFSDCDFSNISGNSLFHLKSSKTLKLQNCNFRNISVDDFVYAEGIVIDRCVFEQINTTHSLINSSSGLEIISSRFRNIPDGNDGYPLLYTALGSLAITSSNFTNSFPNRSIFSIMKSDVDQNLNSSISITGIRTYNSGGIELFPNSSISDSTLRNFSGSMFVYTSFSSNYKAYLKIKNCMFDGVTTALDIRSSSNVEIITSTFTNGGTNTSSLLEIADSDVHITSSKITQARSNGISLLNSIVILQNSFFNSSGSGSDINCEDGTSLVVYDYLTELTQSEIGNCNINYTGVATPPIQNQSPPSYGEKKDPNRTGIIIGCTVGGVLVIIIVVVIVAIMGRRREEEEDQDIEYDFELERNKSSTSITTFDDLKKTESTGSVMSIGRVSSTQTTRTVDDSDYDINMEIPDEDEV